MYSGVARVADHREDLILARDQQGDVSVFAFAETPELLAGCGVEYMDGGAIGLDQTAFVDTGYKVPTSDHESSVSLLEGLNNRPLAIREAGFSGSGIQRDHRSGRLQFDVDLIAIRDELMAIWRELFGSNRPLPEQEPVVGIATYQVILGAALKTFLDAVVFDGIDDSAACQAKARLLLRSGARKRRRSVPSQCRHRADACIGRDGIPARAVIVMRPLIHGRRSRLSHDLPLAAATEIGRTLRREHTYDLLFARRRAPQGIQIRDQQSDEVLGIRQRLKGRDRLDGGQAVSVFPIDRKSSSISFGFVQSQTLNEKTSATGQIQFKHPIARSDVHDHTRIDARGSVGLLDYGVDTTGGCAHAQSNANRNAPSSHRRIS